MDTPPPKPRRRWLRRSLLGLAGLALLVVAALRLAPLSDLRPESLRQGISPEAGARGRALLARLAERHGGLEPWRKQRVTEIEYTDEWPSAAMRLLVPFGAADRLRITFANGRDDARLDFLSGARQGSSWGIQRWRTYQVRDGQREFSQRSDIKFWLPTVQYFMEMPFRVGEADVIADVGLLALEGKTYDRVFLSWGRPEPQDTIDQYVLWIEQSSGLLAYAEYTVRDQGRFMRGCVHYEGWRPVSGLLYPERYTLGDCPGRPGLLHRQVLHAVRFLPDLPDSELVPEPGRAGAK